jgi:hypothetical protein
VGQQERGAASSGPGFNWCGTWLSREGGQSLGTSTLVPPCGEGFQVFQEMSPVSASRRLHQDVVSCLTHQSQPVPRSTGQRSHWRPGTVLPSVPLGPLHTPVQLGHAASLYPRPAGQEPRAEVRPARPLLLCADECVWLATALAEGFSPSPHNLCGPPATSAG